MKSIKFALFCGLVLPNFASSELLAQSANQSANQSASPSASPTANQTDSNATDDFATHKNVFDCRKKTYKVALHDFGLFYSTKSKIGIDRDILELLKTKTGCKFIESISYPEQIWRDMKVGKIDFSLSSINNSARSKIARFSYYGTSRSVIIHPSEVHAATSFEFSNNRKLKLGLVRGTSYGAKTDLWLTEIKKQGMIREFKNEKALVGALLAKKISAAISFKNVYETYYPKEKMNNLKIASWFPEAELHGIAFSKKGIKDTNFREFEKILEQMIVAGEIKKIASKYLSEEELQLYLP